MKQEFSTPMQGTIKSHTMKFKSQRRYPIPKEYLGAFKAGHRHRTRFYIDETLSWELLRKIVEEDCKKSASELAYIARFNNEFERGSLKKGDPANLHQGSELEKECYNRKNEIERCDAQTEGFQLISFEPLLLDTEDSSMKFDRQQNQNRDLNHENTLIELIDLLSDIYGKSKN